MKKLTELLWNLDIKRFERINVKLAIQYLQTYFEELREVVANLPAELVDQVITTLLERGQRGNTVFIFGNGGSASTASHFVCDLAKNTQVPGAPRFRVMGLTDNMPLMTAWANDTDYENVFAAQLDPLVEPGDVVIGISCSGNSANVLRAMVVAHQRGATTIGFTGDQGGRLKEMVDLCVQVPSPRIEQQEDAHLILEHCICAAIRAELSRTSESQEKMAASPQESIIVGQDLALKF
ncbi:MAG: SIS domain-containing protein [Chloroflexi bacterium]|nr:SIS domain-containing protein [Chloroflexota bacterium]